MSRTPTDGPTLSPCPYVNEPVPAIGPRSGPMACPCPNTYPLSQPRSTHYEADPSRQESARDAPSRIEFGTNVSHARFSSGAVTAAGIAATGG
ncbi:MAG: hypothetical protein IPM13_19340 [Phycisphaerales bacterium]|nr:hypothetical protein [Phycisphaerales bacterium]